MADNRKYYYLKLKESYFDEDAIVLLESMQDGMLYSNILLKLYLKSLKNGGKLQLAENIPYTAQMIATITRQQVGTVERALQIFMKLGLVEPLQNGALYMSNICDDPFLSLAINLAFACSLRMGELLGLTWNCVDISQDSIEHNSAYIYIDKELQRISRESLAQIGEKGIMFKFPTVRGCNSTVLALKEPKTRTSVRKVFLPRAVAEMLVERKKTVDELKELLGDEYRDYDLVFASTQGTPTEANHLTRAFNKLIKDNDLPKVVFHSLRHTSTTYKLKLSGGDIKAVQGDTGHAQATMVTERYAHILDDDRRVNAARFQKEFYGGGGTVETTAAGSPPREQQTPTSDPLQNLDVAAKQQLLLKLLAESPDMAALLTAFAGRSE